MLFTFFGKASDKKSTIGKFAAASNSGAAVISVGVMSNIPDPKVEPPAPPPLGGGGGGGVVPHSSGLSAAYSAQVQSLHSGSVPQIVGLASA